MFLFTSKLRVKHILAVLLLTLLIVTAVLLICIRQESDIKLLRNKQNETNGSLSTTDELPTSFEPEDRTEETDTSDIWPTEETLTSVEADDHTNEEHAVTNKPRTALEARKAYFAVHGRSVSENQCMEFERNRCEFMDDFGKKLVDIFKRPVVPGKIDRFGSNARDVATGVYPHMGALGWLDTSNNWVFNCASALISPNFILTAAHCSWLSPKKYNLTDPKPQMVRLGNQNILERNSKDYLDVKIQEIIVHPAYKPPLKYSDIALMKLVEEVEFHAHIAPACLTRNPNVGVGDEVDSTGWEYTTAALKGDSSYILNFEISIIDSNVCDGMFKVVKDKNFKGIRSHQLCAGKINQGVDIYQEHSARFIQVTEARVCLFDVPLYTLIGVTAYGFGGAGAGVPSVYTRISSYVDWIEENVWKEELNL